ncbi:MAG: hypothetical protein JOZ51_24480 [Chloroflexi bacterium]|nr:hypothetical protein [Chloroflexota bacterium]
MSRPSNVKRPAGRNAGTNTLITAASLALTLSGWAVLAANEPEPAPPVAASVPTQTLQPQPSLAAVPTLVPEPDWASLTPPTAVPTVQSAPTAVPAPPQAAAPARPAQPPRPAAVTRSSR